MSIKTILYVGENTGNSLSRLNALKRLGYIVDVITPRLFLPKSFWIDRIFWKFSALPFEHFVNDGLKKALKSKDRYDLVWVNAGDYLMPSSVNILKTKADKIINYNTDDPFGGRDKLRHYGYLKAISLYDMIVVVRKVNISEAYKRGAKKVHFEFMAADEVDHKPLELSDEDRSRYSSDVLFIGSWFPERGPFLTELINKGVPLTIAGKNWHKAPQWNILKKHVVAPNGLWGADYVKTIQCARVCLGLLSEQNRDQHTTRSMEIPLLGSLFCGERTPEHESLYEDGVEAIFWDNAEQCAEKCLTLLKDQHLIDKIAENGQRKAAINANLNEAMISRVLENFTSL